MTQRLSDELAPIHDQDIPALTGLRGFAAVWVFVMHACFGNINQYGFFPAFDHKLDWGWLEPLILSEGNLPVSLFFILSGFIMAHVYGRHFKQSVAPRSAGIFYMKRIARIYPVHLFITLMLAALFFSGVWQPVRPLEAEDVWLSAAMLNVFKDPSVNIPAWSISAEWLAYLVCPFILFLMTKIKAGKLDLLFVIALCAAYPYLFREFFCCSGTWGSGAILKVMTDFVIGCFLYRMYAARLFVLPSKHANDILCAILFCGLWMAASFLDKFEINHTLLPFILYYLACSNGFMKTIFAGRIMMFLGMISYCLYMVHYPMLEIFTALFSDFFYSLDADFGQLKLWAFFSMMTAATLLASVALYYGIERPSRHYIVAKLESGTV